MTTRESVSSVRDLGTVSGRTNIRRRGLNVASCLIGAGTLVSLLLPANAGDFEVPLAPAPVAAEDEWQFAFSLNGWGPDINATTSGGASIDISLSDIIESLNLTVQMTFEARKGRWSFGSDFLYMDLQTSAYQQLGPLDIKTNVGLTAWIVTPTVTYSLLEGDWGEFAVLGGARYLYLGVDTKIFAVHPKGNATNYISESGSQWAGIIGFKGHYNFNEKWYLPYYFDIGAGDPDYTIQAFAGVGYHARCYDVILGYRYLKFEFDTGAPLTDMEIKGPILGIRFDF